MTKEEKELFTRIISSGLILGGGGNLGIGLNSSIGGGMLVCNII